MANEMFTPGPWRMIHSLKGQNLHAWIFGKDPTENSKRELQVFSLSDCHPIREHLTRRLADMRLITAAPEMYAILKRVYELDKGARDFAKEHNSTYCDPPYFKDLQILLARINTP